MRALVGEPSGKVRLGIGDDAAAWQPSRSNLSVVTTDALVDGIHFLSEKMEPRAIGHRAMAANLSDIAAMGARPVLATVALGVSKATDERWILECYRGMHALGVTHRTQIVGGDVTRAPAALLSITVVGEVSRTHLKRRAGGKPGDVLAVTGPLGASRAGLELVRRASTFDVGADARGDALRAFESPEPRMREGRWLGASVNVHAMIDCSDGLSLDLARLARASGCGALITDVPVAAAAAAVAGAAGDDGGRYALEGGEDFELIVALAPRAFPYLASRFEAHFKRPLLAVGRLEVEPGLRICEGDGKTHELVPAGWDHLA